MLLRVVVDVIISLCLFRVKRARVLSAARAQKKTNNEGNASRAVDKILRSSSFMGDEAKNRFRSRTHSRGIKKTLQQQQKKVSYIEEPEDDEPNTAVTESKKQTITTKKGHDDIIISEILRVCGYGTVEDLCRCFVVFVGV